MSELGAGVRLYDIVNYRGADLDDLCRLVAMQTEQAQELQETLSQELDQLEMSTLHIDLNNGHVRSRLRRSYIEFRYVMALRWLQLARWHEFELDDMRFYGSQAKILVHNRLVYCMSEEAEWRNRACHAGIPVETLRAQYIL